MITPTTVHSVSNSINNANKQTYLLANPTKGRNFVSHGFTTESLLRKRYNENTSAAAITLNVMLPYLNAFNARLESHIKDGKDLTTDDALRHLIDCGIVAGANYIDVVSRVAIQTGIACYLIDHPSPAGNATVYLWDAYPRMHRKYIGDVLAALRLPKFLSSLLGVLPSDKDLLIYNTRAPFLNCFEDSIRRHILVTIADIIVTNVRHAITSTLSKRAAYKQIEQQRVDEVSSEVLTIEEANALANLKKKQADAQHSIGAQIVGLTLQKSATLVGRAVGAGLGNLADGGRGEYWGELFAGIITATYTASLLSASIKKQTVAALGTPADSNAISP